MRLQIIEGKFSVCKVENLRAVNFNVPWLFVGKTDAEISVVCLTADVPHATLAREDGWLPCAWLSPWILALRVCWRVFRPCWRRRVSVFLPYPPLIRTIY